jgi:hypothetical protein
MAQSLKHQTASLPCTRDKHRVDFQRRQFDDCGVAFTRDIHRQMTRLAMK